MMRIKKPDFESAQKFMERTSNGVEKNCDDVKALGEEKHFLKGMPPSLDSWHARSVRLAIQLLKLREFKLTEELSQANPGAKAIFKVPENLGNRRSMLRYHFKLIIIIKN